MNSRADTASERKEADAVDPALIGRLLRSLLIALACGGFDGAQAPAPVDAEEVLLDLDLDGHRYMILRMPAAENVRASLSPREQEIARMVAGGYASKTIASVLNISSWTVGTHLRRIFAKLGVKSRAAMVGRLHETGLLAHPRPVTAPAAEAPVAEIAQRRRA